MIDFFVYLMDMRMRNFLLWLSLRFCPRSLFIKTKLRSPENRFNKISPSSMRKRLLRGRRRGSGIIETGMQILRYQR